jgi:hypothetical protein
MPNGNSELPELPAPRCTYADHSYPAFMKQQMIDYARAALSVCADGGKGEAVATLHDDGYWTWKKGATPPHESNYAGWRMDVYAAPQAECVPREAQQDEQAMRARICRALDMKGTFTDDQIVEAVWCAEYERRRLFAADVARSVAAPTPERAQESAGVRLTPEQSGAIQIAISILTPEYLLTANRLRSIVATIDAELAKKEGA